MGLIDCFPVTIGRRIISAPTVVLDPISGAFPGATMKWARDRQQKIKKERKVANQ
jgi:hypothetical protein